jgi:hypothetical protein
MASRAHRWPAGNTPLSDTHSGGKPKAADRIKRILAEIRQERLASPPKPPVYQVYVPPVGLASARYGTPKIRVRPSARERLALAGIAPQLKLGETLMTGTIRLQGARCILCGETLRADHQRMRSDAPDRPSFDHVVPRSLGGGHLANRLVAHRQCNSDKSNRQPNGCELIWLAAVNAHLGFPA